MEQELIAACVRQDRSAQRKMYERYSSRMFAVCMRYAQNVEVAKDILQDGFVTLFSKIGEYKNEGSFEGWMRRIFVNTALMQLRKRDVLKGSEDVTEAKWDIPVEDNVFDKIDGQKVMKLISEMPIGFRTVFNLYVLDGFSHQEIARQLNISEGASRSQLSRGRCWLQERINKLIK
mgnify:FL=1